MSARMRNNLVQRVAIAAVATVLSACPAPAPTPPEVPPVITSFTADKTQVTAGAAVKLSFTAERASEVELLDQAGNRITLSGDANAGEATVNPTVTSFYVLRASGAGGRDSAFVQVAVNEGLKQVFLVAVPAEIEAGQTVTVAWSALGGSGISLRDASGTTLSMAESGTLDLQPSKSTTYELRATGLLGPLTASAPVKVRPVVKSFTATPPAARQGQTLTLAWKTGGADSVRLTESTLGEIVTISSQAIVDDGTFDFTVPLDFNADAGPLPDGGMAPPRPVPDNYPLSFTLTAQTAMPQQSATAQLQTFVRDGPAITTFEAPAFVTELKPVVIRWTTSAAHRAELQLDGATVLATLPPATADGTFTIPTLTADVSVTLVVYDFNGLAVRQTKTVRVAGAPKVNTFVVPMNVAAGGSPVTAMWTTTNATLVVIRQKNGPAEFETSLAAMVSAGMTALRPARTTTYVLEAYNAAGDRDVLERTVNVTTPVTTSVTPDPTSSNSLVQVTWDVGAANPADVIGIPAEPPVATPGSTGFFDIETNPAATKVSFSQTNDATASFTTGFGFSVPVVGRHVSSFAVSTNGTLSLGTAPFGPATNVDLKGNMNLPPASAQFLAPFWDDLDLLNTGSVHWLVDGTAFPRRLIVQWSKVHIAGDPQTDMTFQVQLYETGEIRFEYLTLVGMNAQGTSATVGIWLSPAVFVGQHSFNAATLTDGLELQWFTNGPASGVRNIVVGTQSLSLGFFYRTVQNAYVWVPVTVRVFAPNSVAINEVMHSPAASVPEGQWIELANNTGMDIDFGGLELSTVSAPMMPFVIPAGTEVASGSYLVVGQSNVAANNGGATVDVSYGAGLPLAANDTAFVRVLNTLLPDGGMPAVPFTVTQFSWDAGVPGTSAQTQQAIGPAVASCVRTQMFGTDMQFGTPKAANETCFPYTLSSVPVAFEDISGVPGAGPLFPTTSWDSNTVNRTLDAPFSYFGVPATSLFISANGFVSTRPGESAIGTGNKATPSPSTTPVGAIAPFWDDLAQNSALTGVGSNAYIARVGNHTTVQFQKASIWSARTALLDFEVKLFDDGAIEFHYADMVEPSDQNRALGSSATAWLEAPDGGSALPIFINQPLLTPNSAYRFTPKP